MLTQSAYLARLIDFRTDVLRNRPRIVCKTSSITDEDDWAQNQHFGHIVPILTRPRHEQYLFFHMSLAGMNAYNISFPIVPKGTSRVRMVFHAHNTEQEANAAVAAITSWAREMLEIDSGQTNATLPKAALRVYAMQAEIA
nr:hypothetical protein CFP56_79552 [Quercus suber]